MSNHSMREFAERPKETSRKGSRERARRSVVEKSGQGSRVASKAAPKSDLKSAPKKALKASLSEEITARIIADLETGIFPWAEPWGQGRRTPRSGCRETPRPENSIPATGHAAVWQIRQRRRLWPKTCAGGLDAPDPAEWQFDRH
jgi:hypothetical protein